MEERLSQVEVERLCDVSLRKSRERRGEESVRSLREQELVFLLAVLFVVAVLVHR
jgi:hypothetical protein